MTDSLVERVARAIHNAMDIADGLDGTAAETYARAAIAAVRQALVEEAESMKFSEDRHGLLCAVESIDEAMQ